MAQALYDAHPLQEYLKESGDQLDTIPGGLGPYAMENEDETFAGTSDRSSSWQLHAMKAFRKARRLFRLGAPTPDDDFAERFKYDVISSSLLNSSISTSPSTSLQNHVRVRPMSPMPPVPGQMPSTPIVASAEDGPERSRDMTNTKANDEVKSMSGAFVLIGLAALMNQHRLAAALAMVSSLFFTRGEHSHAGRLSYISQTMEALEALKAAGTVWDNVMSDTMELLEGEERSAYFTSVAPHSPSSPLRIALHSSLLTTQQQCDNVRPLLAALASPAELSQLSEMYAPPSPSPAMSSFKLTPSPRPSSSFSSPSQLDRNSFVPARSPVESDDVYDLEIHTTPTPRDKRSTWNGPYTYMSIANFDRPSSRTQVMRQRVRRRSDVRSVMEGHSAPTTMPTTPQSASLPDVPEAESDHETSADQFTLGTGSTEAFGKAALSLRRRRRAGGFQSLGLVSSQSVPSFRTSPAHTPGSSISRFTHTPLQIPRHPFSLPALRATLNSALASRRYACAHLLALRFCDDIESASLHRTSSGDGDYEDDAYWENVRAVMALLTSTLEDASSRLGEALEEAVGRGGIEGYLSAMASPCPSPAPSPGPRTLQRNSSPSRDRELADTLHSWRNIAPPSTAASTSTDPFSLLTPRKPSNSNARHLPMSPLSTSVFAPAPTRLSRFAEHVDAMAGALEDAKGHLWQSVRELRDGEVKGKRGSLASSSGGFADGALSNEEDSDPTRSQEDVALQSYDRLRRELGLALRECERGRGVLLNIIEARRRQSSVQIEQDEEEVEHSPTSGPDVGSGDSESDGKHDGSPSTPNDGSPILALPTLESVLSSQYQAASKSDADDDATQHLLLTSTPSHLPAPGAEQIFECEIGSEAAATFNRERSKLSRQERIRIAKARRESGMYGGVDAPRAEGDEQGLDRDRRSSWGPGTEVVQELKDVIWKVGERRRRLESVNLSGNSNDSDVTTTGDRPEVVSSTASPQSVTLRLDDSESPRGLHTNDYTTTLETL